jgi:hypothetical protein
MRIGATESYESFLSVPNWLMQEIQVLPKLLTLARRG